MNPTPRKSRACLRHVATQISVLAAASSLWAQTPASPTPAPVEPAAPAKPNDTIELTPFQVDAAQDKGYFAENTLAGSRMRTNISDLGASISVVTMQQMEDTASVDINDVFRYEINTEGSSTYTPAVQSLRNDGVIDQNAGVSFGGGAVQTNATANRVRGIGVPSSAINYYPSISQVPVDSYNIQSLEISRGPNSMLFGMGSPAGIVNINQAQAVLNRDRTTVTARADDRGSFRSSVSFNRGLIEDKLAIYAAALYDGRRFERKPSYDNTRRQYGAITFKPFPKTVIRASAENYANENRRPNTLTPRDGITPWLAQGKPTYDPVSKTVTVNGRTVGPYVAAASSRAGEVRTQVLGLPNYNPALRGGAPTGQAVSNTNFTTYNGAPLFGEGALTNTLSVLYVPGLNWTNAGRSTMQIVDGQLVNWFMPTYTQRYRTQWGTATNPAANADLFPAEAIIYANPTSADVYNRHQTASGFFPAPANLFGASYRQPGVTNKEIYDWERININQMNFGSDRNQTYNVELEQELLSNLHLSAGWFRQNFTSTSNFTVAQLNVATLFVDTNLRLPNGQLNPMYGKPYVEDFDADQAVAGEDRDQYRALLAYTPDFRQKDGWLSWLGHHQILGLVSKEETTSSFVRRRLHISSAATAEGRFRFLPNQNANADGTPTGYNLQGPNFRRAFYLAGPGDPEAKVTQSSGEWDYSSYAGEVTAYNYATNQFQPYAVGSEFLDWDNATGRNQREIESLSAGMTNYLWNERLVTTFGVRTDDFRARRTTTASQNRQELSSGDPVKDVNLAGVAIPAGRVVPITPIMTPQERWVNGIYQTERVFERWDRWDELSGSTQTMGGVLRPFRNWGTIDGRAESGSLFWEFVRDFGVSYNKSDNFNAPSSAQVDPFGAPLPKPTGEGKDYGFQFSLFNSKLFARVTWFEATNQNERTALGTAGRIRDNFDVGQFRNWARTIALINRGYNPRDASFGVGLTPAEETAVQNAVNAIYKQDYNYYANIGDMGATRDAQAEGVEVQLNYNPTSNWTMRFTAGKQETVYTSVIKQYQQLKDTRLPVWQAAKAADYLLPQYQGLATYSQASGRQVDLTNFLTSYGYTGEVRLDDPFGNTTQQQYFDGVVEPQAILARDLEGQLAPGQRRYRWSYLTNYNFTGERLRGWSIGGSQRWEDKAVIGYYGRASGANGALLDSSDITRPIYDSDNYYTDFWVGYTRRILNNKARMKIQLNVNDVFEGGGLKTTAVNLDGSPYSFRIVDPRQYVLSATLEF